MKCGKWDLKCKKVRAVIDGFFYLVPFFSCVAMFFEER